MQFLCHGDIMAVGMNCNVGNLHAVPSLRYPIWWEFKFKTELKNLNSAESLSIDDRFVSIPIKGFHPLR
jgi:hypothetical protein